MGNVKELTERVTCLLQVVRTSSALNATLKWRRNHGEVTEKRAKSTQKSAHSHASVHVTVRAGADSRVGWRPDGLNRKLRYDDGPGGVEPDDVGLEDDPSDESVGASASAPSLWSSVAPSAAGGAAGGSDSP